MANLHPDQNSPQPAGFVDRAEVMLAQQFDKLRDATFLVRAKMIVDMPAEVILAKLLIVFRAAADDVIERIQTEILRLAKLKAKAPGIETAAQCPNGINKREIGHRQPRRSEVIDLVFRRSAQEVDGRVAYEKHRILFPSNLVRGQ